jgi:hypothetical protein
MAVDLSPETQESNQAQESPPTMRPVMSRGTAPEQESEEFGADLLVYGTDEILKGTDTATLVAFAALAYQQIKGKGEPHQNFGCVLLLLSILACAVVHLSIGNAYVGRARMILKRTHPGRRQSLVRMASYGVSWLAATVQFVTLIVGLVLILLEKAPAQLLRYLKPFLQA